MKKTLITLAALAMASVASAADLTTVPIKGADWDNSYAGDYTFTFKIFNSDDVATTGTILAYYANGATGADSRITYALSKQEVVDAPGTYTYTLQVGRTGDGDSALTFVNGGTYTGLVANEVYTLVNNISGVTQVAKLTDSKGSLIDNSTGDDWTDGRLKYNGAIMPKDNISTGSMATVYFNENFSESRVITPDTPAVPEPATATLSLLALAGLAARRRRK